MRIKDIIGSRPPLAVVALVSVVAAAGGTAYAASREAVGASSAETAVKASSLDTVMTLSSANVSLSPEGGSNTSILTVTLPASNKGSHYVLTAQGDLVNFGPSDYTRCSLVVNGTQVAAVSTIVGDPSAEGAQGPAAFLGPFALTGGADVPAAGGTAVLQCEHDNSNGAVPYVDQNTSVWAHRTASLTTATE